MKKTKLETQLNIECMARTFVMLAAAFCCFCSITSGAWAETFCVSTSEELQNALDEAADNWKNDYIHVVQGTYTGNFSFGSHQHWPITIRGGYTPNCTSRVDNPSNTVLDAKGSGTVLSMYQHAGGGVHIEGLTLQNGGYWGLWVRLINEFDDNHIEHIHLINNIIKDTRGHGGVYMMSEPGEGWYADPILIYDNIIAGNIGSNVGGVSVLADWRYLESYIVFRNNIIAGNISTDLHGGVGVSLYYKGNIYFTNNTITQNQTLSEMSTIAGGLRVGVGSGFHAYNNIIRGNVAEHGVGDISVYYHDGSGTGRGFHNNYSDMSGSWTESDYNLNVNPSFVNPGFWHNNGTINQPEDDYWVHGDYHLDSSSECIDSGTNDAPYPGSLPPNDFEGDPRIIDGDNDGAAIVDIGADEFSETMETCEGDFDTDGDVDGSDLAVFAADFGRTDCAAGDACEGDFDIDDDVDGSDLAVFAADFGRTDCR